MLQEFYAAVANSPVDIVYLGDTVCSRRHLMRLPDWIALAQKLSDAGKEVVLSTQTLIESESDLKTLLRITGNKTFRVEANDMGAARLLHEQGIPFVAGQTLNIYNPRISPQAFHTARIVQLFRDTMDEQITPQQAMHKMQKLMPEAACDGYWHGKPGQERLYAKSMTD